MIFLYFLNHNREFGKLYKNPNTITLYTYYNEFEVLSEKYESRDVIYMLDVESVFDKC